MICVKINLVHSSEQVLKSTLKSKQ